MSSKKTAQRRIGLMAGSSLVAASLSAVAFTSAALAPTAALADDECGAQAGTTPIVCDQTTYFPDVTYDADGDLVITFTATTTEVGIDGINLTGDGTESITFDSATTSTELESRETVGPLLDVSTVDGDIVIMTEEMDADGQTPDGVTHAIRAIATGAGDVSITTTGNVDAQGSNPAEAIGIEARSGGGDVTITTGGNVHGEAYGIVAAATGSGTLTLNIDGNVWADSTNGIAAISLSGGTGETNIFIDGEVWGNTPGYAIRASSDAAVNVDIVGRLGRTSGGNTTGSAVDFTGVTAGGAHLNFTGATSSQGRWQVVGDNMFSVAGDSLTMGGVGENLLDDGASIDFGGGDDTFIVTDAAEFNIGNPQIALGGGTAPYTNPGASIDFGAGDDLFMLDSTAEQFWQENTSIDFGAGDDTFDTASKIQLGGLANQLGAEIDFGTGDDTFNNSSIFAPNGAVTLSGLEAFNNSGTIYFGLRSILNQSRPVFDDTDRMVGDVVHAEGATFTGSDGSRLVLDVGLDSGTQVSCAAPTGVTDCLNLAGGATAGQTQVTINDGSAIGIMGAYNPVGVAIIDVNGGTSDASHFILDPNSENYVDDPTYGGVIEQIGLFVYALRYDEDSQRHVVVGLPRSETMEYAMLSSAAQSIWHMTTETVTDRQADLRAAPDTGALWMRTTGEYSKRDVTNTTGAHGYSYTLDNSYSLYAGTIMGGLDLIQGRSGGLDYVVGAQIGYVGSSFELDNSPSSGHFSGATGGIYGSIWNDHVFLDATFNVNGLTLDYDSPGTGTKTNTYTTAFGGRLEGGMRYEFSEIFFAEPLATLSFVRTGFEEISLFGGEVLPADAQSRRAALGLRVGGDIDGQIVNWSYFLTGRAWNEFDGESKGVVNNSGVDLPFMDEFDGGFGQVEAGLSLYNDANTLSGFASSGVKWMDGYSAIDLSLGLRMAW